MKKNKRLLVSIFLCLYIIFCFYLNFNKYFIFTQIILSTLALLNKGKYRTIVLILIFISNITYFALFAFEHIPTIKIFTDIDATITYIRSYGSASIYVYFFIQLLQVIILPIPAQLTTLSGVVIYGPLQTFFISTTAVILGSLINFIIGKKLGYTAIQKIFKDKNSTHYVNKLKSHGYIFLPLYFLLPIFPDDLICFIAGTTNMSLKYFSIITVITRPIGILFICIFGSGNIIPFHSWGLVVWGLIIIIFILTIPIILKKQSNIENWLKTKLRIQSKKV